MGGRGNAAQMVRAADEVIAAEAWRPYFEDFVFPYAFYGPEEYERWLPEAGLQARRVELLPKDMTHANRAGLAGWIRTTWLPYTQRLPTAAKEKFVSAIADRYLAACPPDADGQTHVAMVRLEVEAARPDSGDE
jgi:trans-aconitate methyltransferase